MGRTVSGTRFNVLYHHIFSLQEWKRAPILVWALGALIFAYFVAFQVWISSLSMTRVAYEAGTHICWPYFQSCGEYLFLHVLPYGYSQSALYMALFGTLLLAIYFLHKKAWAYVHLSLLPSFVWHMVGTFVLTMELSGNYDYYLAVYGIVLLFLPHKEFFLKVSIVLLYVLSTVAKLHPAWIHGTYFSTLKLGLPFVSDFLIPVATNLVIALEMIFSWMLLAQRSLRQRIVFFCFVAFHLYSGILVMYRYPATVLPMLIVMFGPLYRYTEIPRTRKSVLGWTFLVFLVVMQCVPLTIRGDEKLTLEGNYYGLYMFESNHQCVSQATLYFDDGTDSKLAYSNVNAWKRCDPYAQWFRIQTLCGRLPNVDRISWTFDHSINGSALYRIVDTSNVCALTYKPFRHNMWITTEQDDPPVIGNVPENIYY
jgi:hypothetical protein